MLPVSSLFSKDFHAKQFRLQESYDVFPRYHLATGSEDHSTKIWDLRMHKCIYTIPAHNNMITFCKFAGNVNSSMLITASYDGTAKVGSSGGGGPGGGGSPGGGKGSWWGWGRESWWGARGPGGGKGSWLGWGRESWWGQGVLVGARGPGGGGGYYGTAKVGSGGGVGPGGGTGLGGGGGPAGVGGSGGGRGSSTK